MRHAIFRSIVAAIGSFLFGYHTAVISGALLFITNEFSLTIFEQELVVSTLLIGGVLGAFGAGFLADFAGRKKTLFAAALLFLFGTFILMDSAGLITLMIGRFVAGFAIGIASVAVPLYIAEIANDKNRGSLVSINQLAITIGIFVATLINYFFAETRDWREMFAFAFIPATVQLVGLFFISETPSWLAGKASAHKKEGWKALYQPNIRKALIVGIGVSVLQQITGINTVFYYAPRIFEAAGYKTAETAIFATMLLGAVNVAVTVLALWLIDRIGRRVLLLVGLLGMGLALALLGYSFIASAEYVPIATMILYVSFFAVSLGPVTWLLISEIFPVSIRGRAMGIAALANWLFNYVVSITFLTLLNDLGAAHTFWLYTIICLIGFWFVYKLVPETKGKSFSQIQNFWKN